MNDAITNRVCQRTAHSLFPDEISDAPLEDGEEEVFDHTSVTSPSKSSKSKSSQSASSSDSNGSEISSVSGSDVDSVSETDSISETDSVFSTGTQDHVSDVVGEVATSVETAVSELEKEIMDDNKEGDDSDLDTAPIPSRSTSTSSTSSTAPKASHSAAASECCCLCKAPSTLHYDPYALWVPTERTKMDRNAKPLSTSKPSLNTIICNEYCTRQSKRVEVCPKVVRNEGACHIVDSMHVL